MIRMCQEILLAFTQSQSQTHDTYKGYNPQINCIKNSFINPLNRLIG